MMEKTTINKINSMLESQYDLFLCSASFEDRCMLIPNELRNKKMKKILIFANKYGSEILIENCNKLKSLYDKNATCIFFDIKNSVGILNQIDQEIDTIETPKELSVLVDVSTFTHEILLILLKVLKNNKKINSITCAYINATEYCPNVPLEKKWLSKGAEILHPVMGYSGMLMPSLKTHLIVIVVYEYSRAFSTIADVDPSTISLIYGSSSSATTDKDKDANSFFKNLVEEMAFEYSDVQSYQIPCSDADEVSNILKSIYEKHAKENIIVIPMNNKISTIGVFLSIQDNENVQVCYAPAILYNERNYSKSGNDCYIYKL